MGFFDDFAEGFLWGPKQISKGVSFINEAIGKGRQALKAVPLVGGALSSAVDTLATPLGTLEDIASGIGSASDVIDSTVNAMENLTPEMRERVKNRLERERRIGFKTGMAEQRGKIREQGIRAFEEAGGVEGKLKRREKKRAELLSQAREQGFNSIGEMSASRQADSAIMRSINAGRSVKRRNLRLAGLR